MPEKFLGIDASTQSLTAVAIDCGGADVLSESVNFEKDLPSYGTRAGSVSNPSNPLEVWSYPRMWLDALDLLFERLSRRMNLGEVSAIGGSGQQHASVWLSDQNAFGASDGAAKGALSERIAKFFSSEKSPIWMDASTSRECAMITSAAGGEDYVLEATGSIATERFTAAQILKMRLVNPDVYEATKRIHLNSSFICSVLCGKDMPVDLGDGAGMNLLNLRQNIWDRTMLDATAPGLEAKLPKIDAAGCATGKIAQYFRRNYGFSDGACVCVFTGDNPASLVGVGASEGSNAAISLGTSDTFFCSNNVYAPVANAHVFGNPSGGYMNLICFRNGSLAREAFKNELQVDWNFFDRESFENSVPKNDGMFAVPFYVPEISPKVATHAPAFFGIKNPLQDKARAVRLFIEGQFMNMFIQAQRMRSKPENIVLTGGASGSDGIAQTISDIFNAPVFRLSRTHNSAALGAAMRAACVAGGINLAELENKFCSRTLFKTPKNPEVYAQKLADFKKILESLPGYGQ